MTDPGAPLHVWRVARCAEHGLHGCRDRCFVCGGPVEQVDMVELADVVTPSPGGVSTLELTTAEARALLESLSVLPPPVRIERAGARAGRDKLVAYLRELGVRG